VASSIDRDAGDLAEVHPGRELEDIDARVEWDLGDGLLRVDWRRGEEHFMALLADGDEASNNGNWQWISSVGVDPAPYFRRMYNPSAQQMRHDPDGVYVRRWVPELRDVPLERLAEPWTMSEAEQEAAGCVIGRDYPQPIVDHKQERERAMARYRAVGSS
jgi:deoxyribodipyrimidine photo-lyase